MRVEALLEKRDDQLAAAYRLALELLQDPV